jgi:crotonobetainyl-CoA:carnitine CoA-transferase CaiB-like acyl-CoA transferase
MSYADHASALCFTNAILAALGHRERAGQGQAIDASMLESAASFAGPIYAEAAAGVASDRSGVSGILPAAGQDRWLAIDADTPERLEALHALAGAGAAISRWTSERDAEAAAAALQAAGVPAHPVYDAADLLDRDPTLTESGFWLHARHPDLGGTRSDAPPSRLSRTPHVPPRAGPRIGQHTGEVLRELLGMGEDEIAALQAIGALD